MLLACDKLNPAYPLFWRGSFTLIEKIVSNVDYKGVREIMKTCLERAQNLPSRFSSSELNNVTALERTLRHILDRQVHKNMVLYLFCGAFLLQKKLYFLDLKKFHL